MQPLPAPKLVITLDPRQRELTHHMALIDRANIATGVNDARMSFGDHLEELRMRIIRALIGLAVATCICFYIGDHIIEFLATPYVIAMEQLGCDPRMVQLSPLEPFVEYFAISLKFGIALAGPWVIYQLWKFVAVGLYPAEQKMVRFFAPSSIGLFVTGAAFMVFIVLSGLMKFLIGIASWFPLPGPANPFYSWLQEPTQHVATATTQPESSALILPTMPDDPAKPHEGQVWINTSSRQLSAHFDGQTHVVALQSAARPKFVQPLLSISEYLDFVVNLSIAFGLGFQIPVVVVFLIAIKILSASQIAKARKHVILCVFIAAAVITPSPDVGTMLLLAVPMVVLFELGLVIGRFIEKDKPEIAPDPS
jgi:sec-independent protein translocase protein TatC